MWEYTDKLKDYFFNPRNVGEVENPDGVGEVGSLACGDALRLTFKLDKDGRIADAKFKTFGCASAIATSSVLSREALEAAIANYRGGDKTKHEIEGNIVCTCFGVTDKEIERVVRENDLTTVEQVTNYCKAGGGCGGCHGEIEKIIERVQGEKVKEQRLPPPRKGGKLTTIQKIQLIQQTINEQVRPALRAHGGNIELIDVEGNKVLIAFRGMCAQCKISEFTMREVVEAKLREFVAPDLYVEEDTDGAGAPEGHEHRG
ncbi:MAG: iron-sulfur cluster assembly scaffold protein [Planctomycetes bacterium]|nr:iron-sulfur cluster assembly scaffold protein [Planctomycetota bacterium]